MHAFSTPSKPQTAKDREEQQSHPPALTSDLLLCDLQLKKSVEVIKSSCQCFVVRSSKSASMGMATGTPSMTCSKANILPPESFLCSDTFPQPKGFSRSLMNYSMRLREFVLKELYKVQEALMCRA